MPSSPPRVRPGDAITADAYNALAAAFADAGLAVATGDDLAISGGVLYSTRKREHWLKLTSSSGTGTATVYAWTAVERDGSGGWVETALSGTTTDNPARAINAVTTPPTLPYYVRAVMEPDGPWIALSDCP